MGGGRDKRKKQKGHVTAGKGADKTARKTERNETKAQRRSQKAAQVTTARIRARGAGLEYHPGSGSQAGGCSPITLTLSHGKR